MQLILRRHNIAHNDMCDKICSLSNEGNQFL